FTADATGTYVLRWTISNGTCAASTADVTVNFYSTPVVSNAGPAQNLCNVTNTTLAGNDPTPGTGLWTLVSGPNSPAITTPTAYNTTVTTMVPGIYVFKWTISNGVCTPSESTVTITNYATPTTASVGAAQNLCGTLTSASLGGNTPTNGTGAWSIVSGGTGTFSNAASGSSTFTADAYGAYVLRWTISNGVCTASTDDVTVTYHQTPTTATVGATQNLCGVLVSAALGGNTPVVGTGSWSIVSGGTGTFSASTSGSSTFTANAYGTYVLRWSISNGTCPPSTADITVNFYAPIAANAGSDQSLCNANSTFLVGNTPASGSGVWSVVSGPNTPVLFPSSGPTVIATSLIPSTTPYVFRYTITNGVCTSSDDVTVTNYNQPTAAWAGNDQTICSTTPATVTMAANTPVYGNGLWTEESGASATITDATSPASTITGLSVGTYVFRWTITNGPCQSSSDLVQIVIGSPATVYAGVDQTICEGSTATMSASASAYVTLSWSTSGSGSFNNNSILNPVYTPSSGDVLNSIVTLTLTATAVNGCPAVNDQMIITINKAPVANAGSNATICQGSTYTVSGASASNYSTIIWTSNGTGSLSNAGTLTPTYTPGVGETGNVILTLTANPNAGCSTAATSTMTITITPAATVSAGADATICETGTYTLSGSSASNAVSVSWTTSGTGLFNNANTLHPIYTPSAADIAAGVVTLTITATPASPCTPASDAMVLNINRQATVNAGSDATICETAGTYTISGSSAQYATVYHWTTSGTGTFDDTTVLHPVYTPSASDIIAGNATLTVTVSSVSPCTDATDAMVLNINRQAVVNAGTDATICESAGNYTISGATAQHATSYLWTTSGTGTFNNATTLNPIYTPSAADITVGTVTLTVTATSSAPCVSASDAMTLNISRQAKANAGTDATICEGSAYTVITATANYAATTTWTHNGLGTLTGANTLTPTYTPAANETGVITLTLTATSASPCVDATDQMTITITPAATVFAGADATICETGTYTLSGSSASNAVSVSWTTSGTGLFNNANTLHPIYTPSAADIAAGAVTLTITATPASPCTTASDAMVLNINREATVNAGSDATICETAGTYTITGSSAQNATAYLWATSGTGTFDDATVLHPVYNPSAADIIAGNVTLTVTASSASPCTDATDAMVLNINRQAVVNAGADATICESAGNYTISGATAQHATSYLWTTSGTGTFNNATTLNPIYTPSAADITAGTVILTITANSSAPCVSASDAMTLNISRQATANAGTDATICEGSTYTVNTATANYAVTTTWTHNGLGTLTGANTLSPTYTPAANETGIITLTLTATSASPCVDATDQMTITITPAATVNAGSDATICETGAYTLSGSSASNAVSVSWTTSGTGLFNNANTLHPIYTPSAADIAAGSVTLTITATPASPCTTASDAMVLNINRQATVNAGSDATICEGSAFTVSTATSSYAATTTWTHNGLGTLTGANTLTPTYTPAANETGVITLTLTSTSASPCVDATDQMTITITPAATVSAGADATICETGTYTLSGSSASNAVSVSWTTSGTGLFNNANTLHPIYTPSATDIAAGSVTLTITATPASPCTIASDAMVLNINRQATVNAGSDATICETAGTYTITGSSAQYATAYLWTTSGTGMFDDATTLHPVYTPSAADIVAGNVTLTVTASSALPCTDATDAMILNINRQALVNAGVDATICESAGNYALTGATAQHATSYLWTTSGTGTFNNATTLNPIYTPSAADITAGTVILTVTANSSAPCISATDAMTLNISRQAKANAGTDATICEGSAYTVITATANYAATTTWTHNGLGTLTGANTLTPTYTPAANETGVITLTLTATSASPCVDATDQMTITITPAATVFAGADATICETGTYTLSGSSASNAVSVSWTTSGTGLFNNANTLHPIYTPSAADIAAGSVTLTITATPASPCTTASDAMVLNINRQATVNAGADATICETAGTYTISGSSAQYATAYLWATSGTGTFGDATALHPVYSPSAADIIAGNVTLTFTASSASPCTDATDAMVLNINRQAVVNAGVDATICESAGNYTISGATAQHATSYLWTTSGTGTFNNATTLNPIYTPSAADITAGTVTLTVTANSSAPCVSASDAMTLNISRQATANAGTDATICEGSAFTVSTATANYAATTTWTHNGLGTLTGANTLTPTYTPAAGETGVITLTLTATSASPCVDATDQMTITITPAATVSAGPDATICETGTYNLSGSSATNAVSVIWTTSGTGLFNNANTLHPIYTPSAADIASGSVTLTITATPASPCTTASDAMVLNINRQAIVNAGSDATLCETAGTYTLSGSSAQYATAYLWATSGTGTFDVATALHPVYTPSAADITAGNVTLTVTASSAAPCGTATDAMILNINRQAVVNAGADATICESAGNYTLTGATAQHATSYLWTTSGTGTFNNATMLNPIYTPSAADITAGTVTLTVTANSSAPCVSASDAMTLTITHQATVNAGSDATICETAGTYTITGSSAQYATAYLWTTSGTGTFDDATTLHPVYTPSAADIIAGTITLTVTASSALPCTDATDAMVLNINRQAVVNAGADATICESAGNYTLTGATAQHATSYLWTTSGTGTFNNAATLNPIYTPSAADIAAGSVTLTITATPASPCTTASDAMVLNINRQATANAGTDATICEGSTFTINTAAANYAAIVTWTHNGLGTLTGANTLTPTYTPAANETGVITLTLTATSASPCVDATDQMTITITPAATVSAGADATICETGSYTLSGSSATNAVSVIWSTSGTGSFNNIMALHPIYTPSAADIAAGSAILTLTVNPASPCALVSDAMVLTINHQATAYAGTDAIICQGSAYTVNNATANYATTVTWTHNGLGTLAGAGTLTPTYTPAVGETGVVTLTLTSTSASPCVDVTDQMTITITPAPTVSAGPDQTICETSIYTLSGSSATNAISMLWSTSGTGSFTNAAALHTTYIPSAADILNGSVTLTLTVFPASPCGSISDDMVLNISHQAVVNAGADASICEGSTFTVSAATANYASTLLWSHNGLGTLTGANTLTPTYTPASGETGLVTLTLTATSAGPCINATDQMILSITPAATVNAGPDATICETGTYALNGSSATNAISLLWSTSGTGSFSNAAALNPVYSPSAADILNGTVTLTLTVTPASPCATVSDAMVLNINRQAIVDAGSNATICESAGNYTITGSSAQYATTYLWTTSGNGTFNDATLLHPTYTPGATDIAAGSVTLTVTAGSTAPCISAVDAMVLIINRQALVNAGADAAICETGNYPLIGATAQYATSYHWTTTGTGIFSNPTALNPVYTPSPNDILDGFVTLTLTATSSAPCVSASDVMVLHISRQAIVNAGPDMTICQGTTFTMSAATAQYATTINWTSNGTGTLTGANTLTPVYTPGTGETGDVILTISGTSAFPCSPVSDQMTLHINSGVIVSAGQDDAICETSAYTLTTSSASNYSSLLWTTSGEGMFNNPTGLHPTYVPSASDILNGSVVLTLTAAGIAPCGDISDNMTLTISHQAIVNAGPDASLCQGSSYTVSGAAQSYATSILWTHNGTGTLTGATTLTPTYLPAASETGDVTLTMTAASAAPCIPATDQMVIHIYALPTAFAGPNDTICEGSSYTLSASTANNFSTLIWSTSGTGTFNNAGALHPVYVPSQSDVVNGFVYLVLSAYSNGPCSASIDSMQLFIHRAALATAGPDATLCEGSNGFTVTAATAQYYTSLQWTTNGLGILNNANTISPTYIPLTTETGNITLTLTAYGDAPCSNVVDAMDILIYPAPIASAGNDDSICEGEAFIPNTAWAGYYTNLMWTTSGTGYFSNPTALHPTYTPSASDILNGSVVLTITSTGNAPCGTASDDMMLIIRRAPVANAGADVEVCEGTAYTVSDATAAHYTAILWTHNGSGVLTNDTTLAPTYTPAPGETGVVTLTLTVSGTPVCGSQSDAMAITIHPQPTVDAGPNASNCGVNPFTLAASSASGIATLQWISSGTGTFNNASLLHAIYTPSITDVNAGSVMLKLIVNGAPPCSAVADSMTLSIFTAPIVSAGPDEVTCSNMPYTISNATVSGSTAIQWTHTGAGTLNASNTLTPTYVPAVGESGNVTLTLTATGTAPCGSVSDQMILAVNPSAVANAGSDLATCENAPIQVAGATAQNYSSILWTTNGTGTFNDATVLNPVYTPSATDVSTGMVVLTMSIHGMAPCADVSDQLMLSLIHSPMADAGSDGATCEGSSYMLKGTAASYYNTINWTLTPETAGTLSGTSSLNPTYTPAAGFTGEVTLTMTVKGNSACSNATVTDQMIITVYKSVVANAGVDQTIPTGASTMLDGSATEGSGFYAWSWQPENLLINATVKNPETEALNSSQTFTLTVLDLSTGCSSSDEVMITLGNVNPGPTAVGDRDTTIVNGPVTINVLANDLNPDGDHLTVTFCGYPSHGIIVLNSDNTITYTPYSDFEGDDEFCYQVCDNGQPVRCSDTTVLIHVKQPDINDLTLYNALTPNGDGSNDTWKIRGIEKYPDNTVLIFNRWGDKIREFDGYNNTSRAWDGKNEHDKAVPDGTYFYILEVKNVGTRTGWILLQAASR
ncbi:MAG: gliding motility-associated C-terminal domain-containing protein, partial [Bacteroidetes bacterium]|nr:gliding motility-associated C-terminal domain-containing protein [Bacteroidota bacterium]